MSLISDGVLIATCLTTAIYCLVLSRRLRRLSDTEGGIGQQILRLSAALEETRAAVAEIRSTTKSASEELARDIDVAKRQGEQLKRQISRAMQAGAAKMQSRAGEGTSSPPGQVASVGRSEGVASAPEQMRPKPTSRETIVDFDAAESIGEFAAESARDDAEIERFDDDRTRDELAETPSYWPADDDEQFGPVEEEADATEDEADPDAEAAADWSGEAGPRARVSDSPADAAGGLLRVERMAV